MDKIHKILFVEDEQSDVELNIREIKKALIKFDYQVVCERDAFIDALAAFAPDIVVSDYNMPAFDGLSALKITHENYPFIPFIVVTGSVNEDTAVICMKAGATDYVLKDSLKRLGQSVLNALEQRKIKEERAEAYETIKQNEAKYRYMFHNNPQPMWIYDVTDYRILEVNEAAVRHYGYSQSEFLQMSLVDIIPDSEKEKLTKNLHLIDKESNISEEWEHRKKNREIISVEIVSHAIIFNNRKARHVLISDITNRKKIEEGLQREKKLLRTLIDNLPDSIYIKDALGRKIIANAFDSLITGLNKGNSSLLGKTDLEIFGNENGRQSFADDQKVLQTGIPILNKEELIVEPSGKQKWLLTSKVPIIDASGKVNGLVGIGRDITEQKQAQEKILKLSKGIEQSPVSIEITDVNGIIEYVNPHFCTTTGYSPEEVIGNHARMLRSDAMPPEIYDDLWPTIKSGGIWRKEVLNKRKDGKLYWEAISITSIKNDKGIITNYIAIKQNISERKQMEAELIKAKEKAEESDRLKSAFLANMSHEIRTPLNSIIGFSELLNDRAFDEDQKAEFIRIITENGNNLLSIISDIMDFSMIETQQIKIRQEKFAIKKLLHDIYADFRKKATEKMIDLKMSLPGDLENTQIISDLYRIKQIFLNLTGNAIKFTSNGYVEIGCKQENHFIVFHVKDTGIGIPPEYHDSIFERFRQVDLTKNRRFGGNGLGLSISKNLVELLGGKIWVESEPEKYSNFYFSIPIKEVAEKAKLD